MLDPVPEWSGQLVHELALYDSDLKVPAAHADTALPLPVKPASALQLSRSVLAIDDPVLECAGHVMHALSSLDAALKVSAAHAVTALPLPV